MFLNEQLSGILLAAVVNDKLWFQRGPDKYNTVQETFVLETWAKSTGSTENGDTRVHCRRGCVCECVHVRMHVHMHAMEGS